MKNILILYFSGAGCTKKVAELFRDRAQERCKAELCPVEEAHALNLHRYDGLIVGTPVYHAAPARLLMDYVRAVPPLKKPLPAFVFNTRALWACNTNRILAKEMSEKNIVTVLSREYRSPASDGVLLAPFVRRFFEFEKQISIKIQADCNLFLDMVQSDTVRAAMPAFHIGSLLNAPNKLAGSRLTPPIYLHRDRCVQCGVCVKNCPHGIWSHGDDGFPVSRRKGCESCYRCIHHCPGMALSLRKRKPPKKLLVVARS